MENDRFTCPIHDLPPPCAVDQGPEVLYGESTMLLLGAPLVVLRHLDEVGGRGCEVEGGQASGARGLDTSISSQQRPPANQVPPNKMNTKTVWSSLKR